MHSAPLLAANFAPLRRGACPSLDAPMQTGDGLLARLRIVNGSLTPEQLCKIAALAHRHANGQLEISARGTMQVRGLSEQSSGPFARAVEALLPIRRGLAVETSPLAGNDPTEKADARPLVAAIEDAARPFQAQLAPKLAVVVDGGGQISLGGLKADVRIVAVGLDEWALGFGGADPEVLTSADVPARVAALLAQLAALGPKARATDLVPVQARPAPHPENPPIGALRLRHGTAFGFALPFGATDWRALDILGQRATDAGVSAFLLAPQHCLLAIDAPEEFAAELGAYGFITDPSDPRLRVSACIGSEGCRSGRIPARRVAAQLASLVPIGAHFHVSGCTKGCAHPRPASVTLVGLDGATGLVMGGRAGDTPATLLAETAVFAAVQQAFRQG